MFTTAVGLGHFFPINSLAQILPFKWIMMIWGSSYYLETSHFDLFSPIFCKLIISLHFQSVPAGDGKKMDSIYIPLRTAAFSITNFQINVLRSLLYKRCSSTFPRPTATTHLSSSFPLISSSPEKEPSILVLCLVSQLLEWGRCLLGPGPGTEYKVADVILVIVCVPLSLHQPQNQPFSISFFPI